MMIIRKLLKQKSLYILSLLMFFISIRLGLAADPEPGQQYFDDVIVSNLDQIGVPIDVDYRQINFKRSSEIKVLYRQNESDPYSYKGQLSNCRGVWGGPAGLTTHGLNDPFIGDFGASLSCLRGLYLNSENQQTINYFNIYRKLINSEENQDYYKNGLGANFYNLGPDYAGGVIHGYRDNTHKLSFYYIDGLYKGTNFYSFNDDHANYKRNHVDWDYNPYGYIQAKLPTNNQKTLGSFEIYINNSGAIDSSRLIYRVDLKYDGSLYYGVGNNKPWDEKSRRMNITGISVTQIDPNAGNIKLYAKLNKTGVAKEIWPYKVNYYDNYKLNIMLVCGNKSKIDSDEPYYNCDPNNIPTSD
jgi:hypothetical protein